MKKIYLLLFIAFLMSNVSAQNTETYSKHFVSFRAGYSIPASPSQIGSPRSEVGNTYVDQIINGTKIVSYSEKNSFGSRGSGLNFSLVYGYMITQNVSVEIDFNYLQTLGFNDSYISNKSVNGEVIYEASQKSQTSMFRISPMLGVYANEGLLFRPYAKFGIILPLAGGTSVDLSIIDATSTSFNNLMPVIDPETHKKTLDLIDFTTFTNINVGTKTNIKAQTSGAFSIGFMGRFGAEYQLKNILNNKLKIFAEMEFQMLTVKASKTTIKEFYSTLNNDALLTIATDRQVLDAANIDFIKTEFTEADVPEILITTEYINEVIETSNSSYDVTNPNYDRDKAFEQLTFRDNYNAFGFMIGIKYGF